MYLAHTVVSIYNGEVHLYGKIKSVSAFGGKVYIHAGCQIKNKKFSIGTEVIDFSKSHQRCQEYDLYSRHKKLLEDEE